MKLILLSRLFLASACVLAGEISASVAQGATVAQTNLASITVTPLVRQPGATPDWQPVYDYEGGADLPPGTTLIATGKWIAPVVRKDTSGVTFAFPDLPDQPQAGQTLNIGFSVEHPIANYPTCVTIKYTSSVDQSSPNNWWDPFTLTTSDNEYIAIAGHCGGLAPGSDVIHPVGENTLVFSFDGKGADTLTLNDKDATPLIVDKRHTLNQIMPEPGPMLLPGLTLRNKITQLPANKGDWFTVNSFKIEQMRPPLDASAVAAIDLMVTGTDPVRTTIEVVDANNDSMGYVLHDAQVSPGKYRLYWDGIDRKQYQPKNTAWIGAGAYTFHLTTSKVQVHYAGEINNSVPKYNTFSYGQVNCTAVAMTPPGTLAPAPWRLENNTQTPESRKFDPVDSVQLLCIDYDSQLGEWIGADGTVFNTRTGGPWMQHGRGLAITPPEANDSNPLQYYFTSMSIGGGYGVTSFPLPGQAKPTPMNLTSPDWNRVPPEVLPYKIHIGQIPYMQGPQQFMIFEMAQLGKNEPSDAEWTYRNIRLYEDGSPDPKPLTFDPTLFTPRVSPIAGKSNPPPPGGLTVEDDGHSVHFKNSISYNYPLNYTITPKTILAFDLAVEEKNKVGTSGSGIGLDTQPADITVPNFGRFFNFLTGRDPGRFGFFEPTLGCYAFPNYLPNTLYTDTVPTPPPGEPDSEMGTGFFLWQPGFYGLKISEDGKLLFACNSADNRLEVRDISGDGSAVAKIPINYPMFVALAPDGAAGATSGTRYVYVDSPNEGLLRIAWHPSDNSFGKPETLTPASEFAYPRGITYSAATNRIFVCDTYNFDRTKEANQIVVIDPNSGKVLARFGKKGGVNPTSGETVDDGTFTCPLTIDADSKGALWVNDFYTCEVRKYDFDPASNRFTLERRVLGPDTTNISQYYWLPGSSPNQVWTIQQFMVRDEAELGPDGLFTNQRATATGPSLTPAQLRPFAHFIKVGDKIEATINGTERIFELEGGKWISHLAVGQNSGQAAEEAGLLASPGQPPTALDKAIAASGDTMWQTRPWIWNDLDGDGKMSYSEANPEFQIAFGSDLSLDRYVHYPCTNLRASDGAYVRVDKKSGSLIVIPPKMVNGHPVYAWSDAKLIPMAKGEYLMDVLPQDNRYYVLRTSSGHHDVGEKMINAVECYDETGKLLWTRDRDRYTLITLSSLGDGLFTIMDRGGFFTLGPVAIRTSDGDLVCEVHCQEAGDCWSNGALRVDADTAYIGMVQAYKVTGLTTVKSATVTATLPAGGP
jgi:hypothetical protein